MRKAEQIRDRLKQLLEEFDLECCCVGMIVDGTPVAVIYGNGCTALGLIELLKIEGNELMRKKRLEK